MMHVYHSELGWGEISKVTTEEGKATVDFTDYPYGEKVIEQVSISSLQNSQKRFNDLLIEYGKNPEDFRVIQAVVYRDRMNDGDYIAYNELICVPSYIADKVLFAKVTFQLESVTLFDKDLNELLQTTTTIYDVPTAFIIM